MTLTAASGQYPLLASWLAQPAGPSSNERFSLGLGFLLDGIATGLPMGCRAILNATTDRGPADGWLTAAQLMTARASGRG